MLRGGDNARAPPAAASDNVRDELSQVRLRRRKKGFTNKATREQRRQGAADTTRSCLEAPGAAWALAPDKLKERGLAGPGAVGPRAGKLKERGLAHDTLLACMTTGGDTTFFSPAHPYCNSLRAQHLAKIVL